MACKGSRHKAVAIAGSTLNVIDRLIGRDLRRVAANAIRSRWDDWTATDGPAGDEDPPERIVVWPPSGDEPVPPYLVQATVVAATDVTSVRLDLVILEGGRFQHDGDKINGYLSGSARDRLTIGDLLVDERRRGRGRGSALLNGAEELCRQRGIRWIEGGISPVDDVPRLIAFYRRRGFTVTEGLATESDIPFRWRIHKDLASPRRSID